MRHENPVSYVSKSKPDAYHGQFPWIDRARGYRGCLPRGRLNPTGSFRIERNHTICKGCFAGTSKDRAIIPLET